MGSAGHKFIAHTKALSPRAQSKDGGYGPPPHPRVARPGQCYWPRSARRREVLIVTRVDSDRVLLGRRDRSRPPASAAVTRLLAVRADDQGRYYQFQGFAERRYLTLAYVWSISDVEAVLCLPEWHPRRPVRIPPRLLPADARSVGAWLRLRCDLSASSAGRLQPADLIATVDPSPDSIASPAIDPVARRAQAGEP
jgi:hypothetical protein